MHLDDAHEKNRYFHRLNVPITALRIVKKSLRLDPYVKKDKYATNKTPGKV